MNEIDYVYEVYKERSFSAAAKKLFVSQPALSASIKKLEESLGITIFDRSISPIALTEEGKVYIEAIEEIKSVERQMKERLADLSELKTGRIVLSGENFVSSFVMPALIKRFASKYEGIEVELVESNSPDLRKLLLTDQIDLLVAHDFDAKSYTATPLFEETLLLAVPQELPVNGELRGQALTREDVLSDKYLLPGCPEIDLKAFRDQPFLLLKQGNDMYRRAETLCAEAGFEPKVVLRLDQLITSYNMARSGMGAAFVTDVLVSAAPGGGCVYYKLGGASAKRVMSIGHKKNRYLSHACLAFIETAAEVFKEDPAKVLGN